MHIIKKIGIGAGIMFVSLIILGIIVGPQNPNSTIQPKSEEKPTSENSQIIQQTVPTKNTIDETFQETTTITPNESNLLSELEKVSIPSDELLDLCTKSQVLDYTDKDSRVKCDYMMDIMMRDYCQQNTGHTYTLCRDKRVSQFYNIQINTENIPDSQSVSKIGQHVTIDSLDFQVINYITINYQVYHLQIILNVTNTSNEEIPLNKDNFVIIDERGNLLNVDYAHILYPFVDPETNSKQLEYIPPNSKLQIELSGTTTWIENNILKIIYGDEVRFVGLVKN